MIIDFNKYNKILGWTAFAISLAIYWLTVEPTVSFWDAGEYIATSSSLQVGHPPGAPLYQMLGAFFSMFALETNQVAYMVNMMSVFSSAFSILFMFWSITLLLKRHILKNEGDDLMILGAAFVGSLAFAVSDTFWFNAVEAEVYAPATLLMALMFYVGLVWERDMLEPRGNRWLILLSFIIGLSFGVHFIGILTIPAVGLLWYFKHYKKITPLNFILANGFVVAILLFVFKLLLPYTLSLFGYLEVFFVNDIGLPFNSGTIIAFVAVISFFIYGISLSRKRNYPGLQNAILCILFVLIGFSSWMMLPIRATAGTPINENNPEDARALLAYYNREQYPSTPLFYGESFTDQYAGLDEDDPFTDDKPKYERDYKSGKYVIVNAYENAKQNSSSEHRGILPRMTDQSRAKEYIQFMGGLNYTIKSEYAGSQELRTFLNELERNLELGNIEASEYAGELMQYREALNIEPPTFSQNLDFFINYQVIYMYNRYFAWNFIGRQNDEQGYWKRYDGNWMSGITFLDELRLGTQQDLSPDMLNNPGRNFYYFLPLILGLLGVAFHARKDWKSFYVTLVLFLFSGLAIIFYLNQSMFQVRERDYAYVGSFLVFGMWIGMGVYSIYDSLRSVVKNPVIKPVILVATFLAVPLLMGFQNWDDHDRSGKYTALASARKYLDSCLPNALIFTIGDNDTFPLWYLQEVEGYRTDVRVVCTSLLATDWYMDDMKQKAWESEPVPSTFKHYAYRHGTRDALWRVDIEELRAKTGNPNLILADTTMLADWLKWVKSDDAITKRDMPNDIPENTFPSSYITIPVNKAAVIKNGVVAAKDADKIVDQITIRIKEGIVYKNRMLMLDIIQANNWKRPIYFSGGAFADEDYIWMKDYLQLEGCAFMLTPIKDPNADSSDPFKMGRVDAQRGYKILKKWDWGNSGDPKMYHDPETRRNSVGFRSNLVRVANALTKEGDKKKAIEILDLAMEKMPVNIFGHYSMLEPVIDAYYKAGARNKGAKLLNEVIIKYQEELNHYKVLTLEEQVESAIEIQTAVYRYEELVKIPIEYEDDPVVTKHLDTFNSYMKAFPRFFSSDQFLNEMGTSTFDMQRTLEKAEMDSLRAAYEDSIYRSQRIDTAQ